MNEITRPYSERQQDKQRYIAQLANGLHSLPYSAECGLHLIIYRQATQEEMKQDADGYGTDGRYNIAC